MNKRWGKMYPGQRERGVGKLNLHLVKEAFLHEEVRTRLDGLYGGRGRDIGRTTETKKLVKIRSYNKFIGLFGFLCSNFVLFNPHQRLRHGSPPPLVVRWHSAIAFALALALALSFLFPCLLAQSSNDPPLMPPPMTTPHTPSTSPLPPPLPEPFRLILLQLTTALRS
jgi:hypothetical protein